MKQLKIIVLMTLAVMLLSGCVVTEPAVGPTPIAPEAATWGTWVLADSAELRPAAPPDSATTADELAQLQEMVAAMDADTEASIIYWDAGAPSYRWLEIAMVQYANGPPSPFAARGLALVNVALYDAMIATWDAKYVYNRPRPTGVNVAIEIPTSPSYPSEHAAAAGAASVILSYLFPDQAETFAAQAEEAAQSRLLAGVHYPSDIEVGLALGRAVGERVVAHAMADGTDAVWNGELPTGPGLWSGENPVTPLAGTWQPWTLTSGDQFRASEPPAFDSEEVEQQLEIVRTVERTPDQILEAYFRRSITGSYFYWLDLASKLITERHWDQNPPQAALVYSAMSVAAFDSIIACFDSKYAYTYIRPSQLDPTIEPMFGVPRHPSYPAAHSCNALASAATLGYFFPANVDALLATTEKAGQSRVWAGVHYPMDIIAGNRIGESVAGAVWERVQEMTGRASEISVVHTPIDNLVHSIVSAPTVSNGIVAEQPTTINILFNVPTPDERYYADPQQKGHQIPAGGWMEIEVGGAFLRNGVDNDGEFAPIDSNTNLMLLAGNPQNVIIMPSGVGPQYGDYTIEDDGERTITIRPNRGEGDSGSGENGIAGARAQEIGIKGIWIAPTLGSNAGPAPFQNGAAGTEGRVAVRIYAADSAIHQQGEATITFPERVGRQVAATNFGLITPIFNPEVTSELVEASNFQRVAPGTALTNTERGESFSAGTPYAPRFVLFESIEGQPDPFFPMVGIPHVGLVVDTELPSMAQLVQDTDGNGTLDATDEAIGQVQISGPDDDSSGEILAVADAPLTVSGDGSEGPTGSILAIPVRVGPSPGLYAVTVALNDGNEATIFLVAEE